MATKKSRVLKFGYTLMLLILCGVCTRAFAEQNDPNKGEDFFEMSLEELIEVSVVVSASRQA